MAIYSFVCDECDPKEENTTDVMRLPCQLDALLADPPKCPECGKAMRKRITPVVHVGRTWSNAIK